MRLILRGDKPSARKYISFAKARLTDMKNIMGALGLGYNKKYYKLPDAEIVVESRYGLDSAWIVGKPKIEDICPLFTASPLSGTRTLLGRYLNLAVSFEERPTTFEWETNPNLDYYFYDFNDDTFGFDNDTGGFGHTHLHRYYRTGIYSPKISYSTSAIWEWIDDSVLSNLRVYRKQPFAAASTEAGAWALYLAEPWVLRPSFTKPYASHGLSWSSTSIFGYTSFKTLVDINLTAYDGSEPIYGAFIFNTQSVANNSTLSGGVETSLGGSLNIVDASVNFDGQRYRLIDLTSYAGTIVTDFELRDNSGYSRITVYTGPAAGNFNGWQQGSDTDNFTHRIRTLIDGCATTRPNYITVT